MQTFLPYPDFELSAKCLDRQRLGKQRVEVLQILRTLCGKSDGWRNHPAVKMWRGHEITLAIYGVAVVIEWKKRGYKDTCGEKICRLIEELIANKKCDHNPPSWLGNKEFHESHQSNLLRKDKQYYETFFPDIPDNLEYVWPKSS